MPRHEWMNDISNDIIDDIGSIFEYAKKKFRTEENYKIINQISSIVKNSFK